MSFTVFRWKWCFCLDAYRSFDVMLCVRFKPLVHLFFLAQQGPFHRLTILSFKVGRWIFLSWSRPSFLHAQYQRCSVAIQSYSHNVIDAHKINPAERVHPSDWRILAIAKDPQRQPQQVEEVWRCLPILTGIYVLWLIHKRIMLEAGLVCRAPFFLFLLFRIQGHCMSTCCFGAPYSPWRHNPIFSSKHPWWSNVGLQPLLKARWSRSTQLGWTSCRGPNLLRGSYGTSPPSCPTRSSSRGLRCSSTRDYIGHYPEIYTCLASWLCRARLSAQPHEGSLFFRESWSVAMTKSTRILLWFRWVSLITNACRAWMSASNCLVLRCTSMPSMNQFKNTKRWRVANLVFAIV